MNETEAFGSYRFVRSGSGENEFWVREDLAGVLNPVELLDARGEPNAGVPGRGGVVRRTLGDGSSVIARRFHRGGLVRHLFRDRFICGLSRVTRPVAELAVLSHLRGAKVAVPEPVAALLQWSLRGVVYRGVIVTLEIPAVRNLLLDWGTLNEHDLRTVCRNAGREAKKVIEAGVLHTDLHVGNVLFGADYGVHLIDFDKANRRSDDFIRMHVAVLKRFNRSVLKRGLPQFCAGSFEEGLSR